MDSKTVERALFSIHDSCDHVQEKKEQAEKLLGTIMLHKRPASEKESVIQQMSELADSSLGLVNSATTLATCIGALLEDRREKNAVLQNALKDIANAYGALLDMQKMLGEAISS